NLVSFKKRKDLKLPIPIGLLGLGSSRSDSANSTDDGQNDDTDTDPDDNDTADDTDTSTGIGGYGGPPGPPPGAGSPTGGGIVPIQIPGAKLRCLTDKGESDGNQYDYRAWGYLERAWIDVLVSNYAPSYGGHPNILPTDAWGKTLPSDQGSLTVNFPA